MTPAVMTSRDTRKSFFLEDMGCQMNRVDSELVAGRMQGAGYVRVESPHEADVVLYYTCSVREHAEDKVFGRLGRLKRLKEERPGARIGIMGCMAQSQKDRIFKRAPHVDLVVGTSRFEDVAELVEEASEGRRILAVEDGVELSYDRDITARTRKHAAFVTVMRGCNKFCSFCIVPFTQGRERSRTADGVLDEVKRLRDDGVVEITLLGQRIDTYGLDLDDGSTLHKLLVRIHEEVPGLLRIGFVTSHPNHMTTELARTIADYPRINRYLHLPVQSGSDRVLRRMNRGYSREEYIRAVDRLRAHVPDLALATDWIVGFPGETEADFLESVSLLREIDYQGSFVFKYSPRPGTRAEDFPDDVPREEKERRNHVILEMQRRMTGARYQKLEGGVANVLVEGRSKTDDDKWTGRDRWNRIVHFPMDGDPTGTLVDVALTGSTNTYLFGTPVVRRNAPT